MDAVINASVILTRSDQNRESANFDSRSRTLHLPRRSLERTGFNMTDRTTMTTARSRKRQKTWSDCRTVSKMG